MAPTGSDQGAYKAALERVAVAFDGVRSGAPAEVKSALDDLVTVIRAAEDALTNPSGANTAAIQKLGTQLPADSQTIASYIAAHCSASNITTKP